MTLQKSCIDVIVDEFERYFLAFATTDDAHLKRKFEFLQRVCSYEIASRLYALDKMQANYVDLLVNKYIKVLDTGWLNGVPWEAVVEKFAEVGPKIQKIYFHECSEETPWQNIIHHLINLQVMNFHCDCNDEILKCIAKFCPNIVEIDITSCSDVTNEGIKYLCMKENGKILCPKLKKLSIADSDVNDEGVEYLIQNLRSLEVTDYHDLPQVLYSLHENDLSALDKVEPYNLTNLNLLHLYCVPYYTNILKVCLTLCPHLKSLSFSILKEEHLNLFTSPFELEKLHLECFLNSELNITNFLKLKGRKLQSLWVSCCLLSVPTLAESCPSLKQLSLNQVSFKYDDVINPVFHHLEECNFEGTTNDFTTVKSISLLLKSSPKLDHIAFKRCDLSSSDLKTEILKCCEYCAIKEVIFSGSTVDTNLARDILMNCHSLQLLKLDNCDLSREEEEELSMLVQILPNNPEVDFEEHLSISDLEDDFMYSAYDFEDAWGGDYDDFYYFDGDSPDDDVDYDDDDDDDAIDYGSYFDI